MQSNETAVPIGIAIRADGVMCPVHNFANLDIMTEGSAFFRSVIVPAFSGVMLFGSGYGESDPWNDKACRIVEDGDGRLPPMGLRRDCVLVFVGSPSRQVYRELIAAYS